MRLPYLNLSVVLFVSAAIAAASQPAQAVIKHEHLATVHAAQTLDQALKSLGLETNVGNIEVLRAEGDKLEITADVRVDRKKAADLSDPDKFERHVRVTTEGDKLTIVNAHKDDKDHNAWHVALKVAVPQALAVSATTGVGDIVITFAAGDLNLNSGAGDVTLKLDAAASISATSGAGDVELTVDKVGGRIEANSGAGAVKLMLGTVTGPVDAGSGAGNVALRLTRSGAEKDVALKSGTGTVSLELPAEANGQFDLSTGVGSISTKGCDFIKIVKHTVGATAAGSNGEGGPQYTLNSGVSSVRLRCKR